MDRVESEMQRPSNDSAYFRLLLLQERLRQRPQLHLGRILRRPTTLTIEEIRLLTDAAVEQARLSAEEAEEIELSDAVVRGRDRRTRQSLYLLVEGVWGIGKGYVKRAARRAALLAQTGTVARPVAVGKWANPGARKTAQELNLLLV